MPNMLKLVKNQPNTAKFPKSRFPIPKSQKISGNIKSVKNYYKHVTVISSQKSPQKSIHFGKNVKSCYSSMQIQTRKKDNFQVLNFFQKKIFFFIKSKFLVFKSFILKSFVRFLIRRILSDAIC